jgi:SAM-dependent methyltransferase
MDFSRIMGLAAGHVEARIVQTGLRLGVFDALEHTAQAAESVAAGLHLDRRATELLLNALAALELLRKRAEFFSLSLAARKYLVRSSPEFAGGMILFEDSLWPCWEKLPESIRSGAPARPADMYQADRNETEIFITAMDSLVKARGDTAALVRALNWHEVGDLLDVGSGPGTYPIALCKQFPHIRAAVFDLPGTLEITERCVRDAGMAGRIRLVPGDYRKDAIPGLYDAVFLSNIIHGEDEENNRTLIAKLSRSLKPSGRIIIKDHILDDSRASPAVGAVFSLLMLLTTAGGRCYSFAEIQDWMEQAGLRQIHQLDLPPPLTSSLVIGAR